MTSFITSWSGGKDSCLATYYALEQGIKFSAAINMHLDIPGQSLAPKNIKAQAKAIGVNCHVTNTSWEKYRVNFINTVKKIIAKSNNDLSYCVYGDIDLDEHVGWNQKICSDMGLRDLMPLWKKTRIEIMDDFLKLGFKTKIITVNNNFLDKSYLGKAIDRNLLNHFIDIDVDICGEGGEFHTAVYDGPIFKYPLTLKPKEIIKTSRYEYLDFEFEP